MAVATGRTAMPRHAGRDSNASDDDRPNIPGHDQPSPGSKGFDQWLDHLTFRWPDSSGEPDPAETALDFGGAGGPSSGVFSDASGPGGTPGAFTPTPTQLFAEL